MFRKDGEGCLQGGGGLVFYGRVRDQAGSGVPGALVVVFSAGGEDERPVAHGYCDRGGWYAVGVPGAGEAARGKYTVRAAGGTLPEAHPGRGFSWRADPGRRRAQVECRVINHSILSFTASDGRREVDLEAIPETVCLDCAENDSFNIKMISISGRGYVSSGDERGEGLFTLTVCRFRDVPGGDLLRFTVTPDFPGGPAFDTGGLTAGLG